MSMVAGGAHSCSAWLGTGLLVAAPGCICGVRSCSLL